MWRKSPQRDNCIPVKQLEHLSYFRKKHFFREHGNDRVVTIELSGCVAVTCWYSAEVLDFLTEWVDHDNEPKHEMGNDKNRDNGVRRTGSDGIEDVVLHVAIRVEAGSGDREVHHQNNCNT